MLDPQELISHLGDYCAFLGELGHVPAEALSAPMGAGKWSAQEAIAHIMAWDANFLRTVVLPLEAGDRPSIAEEVDYQAFNERAAASGRQLTKEALLAEATHARTQLVEALRRMPAEAFRTEPQERKGTALAEFLERSFVSHDRHHIGQVRAFLATQGAE